MNDEVKKKIEEIMSQMQCSKNFKCADSNFEILCKAKDSGMENFLDCLEEIPSICSFALSFGYGYLCSCPLRVFLAKKLKK
jgi:hypothetical protein